MPESDPRHLASLCTELRPLLEREIAAGNEVARTEAGAGAPGAIFVLLARPFAAAMAALPAHVRCEDTNDPHWWKAAYVCDAHDHTLACRFA
jgi:hypothetical protein